MLMCRSRASGVRSSKRLGLRIRKGAVNEPLRNTDPVSRTARSISDSRSTAAGRSGVSANEDGVWIIVSVQPHGYFSAMNGARPAIDRARWRHSIDFKETTIWLILEVASAGRSNSKSPDRRRPWAIAIAGLAVRGPVHL